MGKDFDSFRHIRRNFDSLPEEWVLEYMKEHGGR